KVRLSTGATVDGYFNSTIVATRDMSGAIDGVIYFAADVTDLVLGRKRVEELAATVAGERDELLGRPFTGDFQSAQSDYAPRRPDGRPYEIRDFPINRALAGENVRGE